MNMKFLDQTPILTQEFYSNLEMTRLQNPTGGIPGKTLEPLSESIEIQASKFNSNPTGNILTTILSNNTRFLFIISTKYLFCVDTRFQRVIQKYKLDYPEKVTFFDYQADKNRFLVVFGNGHYAIYCFDPMSAEGVEEDSGFQEYEVVKGFSETIRWKSPVLKNMENVRSSLFNAYDLHQGFNGMYKNGV